MKVYETDEATVLAEIDDDESGRATDGAACPKCGERRVDWLIWVDDDWVECQTCGTRYDPFHKIVREDGATEAVVDEERER
jgi:Zn ribbon nucleic-acid-binding protein